MEVTGLAISWIEGLWGAAGGGDCLCFICGIQLANR